VGNKVFCANVGDSRAVLTREKNGHVEGIPLNRDHKANEPDEEKRILMHGGRIEAFKDQHGRPMGPSRVWHLNENIPGLAMSRSFGDHAAAEVGVIAEPEILEMNLTEEDKFIVIASDGVWEFLSNDDVSKIVYPHYVNNSAEKAAEALIRESLKKWKEEESVVDDITCIIIFLTIQ
jgi:serine/threonine protein phosphatase PrpC